MTQACHSHSGQTDIATPAISFEPQMPLGVWDIDIIILWLWTQSRTCSCRSGFDCLCHISDLSSGAERGRTFYWFTISRRWLSIIILLSCPTNVSLLNISLLLSAAVQTPSQIVSTTCSFVRAFRTHHVTETTCPDGIFDHIASNSRNNIHIVVLTHTHTRQC